MDLFGIGSAISGIAGAGATIKASKYNLQAQREANQANRELAEQQNQWNLEQWHRENAYNTPAAQRQRMLDAGINPLGSNFDAGNASQLTSTNLANQQPETVDPSAIGSSIQNAGNMINAVVNSYFQNKKLDAETQKIGKDITYQDFVNTNFAEDFRNRMDLMRAQIGWTNEQKFESSFTRPYRLANLRADTRIKMADEGIKLLEQHLYTYKFENMKLLNDFQRIVNKWKDSLSSEEWKQIRAGTYLTYTQAREIAELITPKKKLLEAQEFSTNMQGLQGFAQYEFFAKTEALQIQQLAAQVYSILSSGRLNDAKYVEQVWNNFLKQSGMDRVINGHFSNSMEAFQAIAALCLGRQTLPDVKKVNNKLGFNNWYEEFNSVQNPSFSPYFDPSKYAK